MYQIISHYSGWNGRWAKAQGNAESYGHVKGCANSGDSLRLHERTGSQIRTVYAFSTENWKRSKEEVDGLMKLFRSYLKKCIKCVTRINESPRESENLRI